MQVLNAHITAVKTTQAAIKELGREEKTLYFLKITTTKGERILNVGEKTYTEVIKLTETTPVK